MSTSPLMAIGMKAMAANYAALQTTGHNIANANVAGYSRQQVELATAQGQFTGAGFFGKGVDVVAVTRSHDEFLTREAASARALAGMDASRLEHLRRLESVFRTGESGLGYAAEAFLNSMVDLVSRPDDSAVRQVVLARAGDLAARYAEAGAALDESQAGGHQRTAGQRRPGQRAGARHRRDERAHRGAARPRPAGQRPARPARASRLGAVAVREDHPHRGRRRHAGDLHRRRPAAGARRRGGDAEGRRRPRRPVACRAGAGGRRPAAIDRRGARWAAARSPACCASRTWTCAMRATWSGAWPLPSPAPSTSSSAAA